MEFCEKLQELRKAKGFTQEELAEALFVSRTAISKWESGRGYPSIDSLKEISKFFSVTIDELLSGEKLVSIAERENEQNIRRLSHLLMGMTDVFAVLMIILPLYANKSGEFIYAVNLWKFSEAAITNRIVYWTMYLLLIILGGVKVIVTRINRTKGIKLLTISSFAVSILAVLILGIAREPYAIAVAFLLLVMKTILLFVCNAKKGIW